MVNIVSWLFRLGRWGADARAVSSGSLAKVARRAKNKAVGRLIARTGIWRKL